MRNGGKILVVDDEAAMRDACGKILRREGMDVREASNGDEALALLASQRFELVILDLKMPGSSGMDVLRKIRSRYSQTAVLVITGYASVETAVEAMKEGALDFLPKPFTSEALRVVARKALAHSRLERENVQLRRQLSESSRLGGGIAQIVGETPQIKAILDLVRRVAPSDSTVLIMGESGTGKELIARAVHEQSERASGPFVVVDCATLVGTLFESELFGHARGSFTGATSTTHGRIELADGGSLFLDEVACIELPIQAKLLRVLEEREIRRVGSNQTISVDVRIIAASNRDLAEAVANGSFREDLYYRLSVVPLVLPPLRQRRADIRPLAEHFLHLHGERRDKQLRRISERAMEALVAHDWPGNVRELSNTIERAVVLAEGDEILPEHLLHHTRDLAAGGGPSAPASRPAVSYGGARTNALVRAPFPTLAELEREHILRALRETGGNKARAAERLGLDRKTLWRKLRSYEM